MFKCGCDQHWILTTLYWILTTLSLTELTLAFGNPKILKRKGKTFVANPKHNSGIKLVDYVECRCMKCPNIREHTIN